MIHLPVLRRLLRPDPGYTILDLDLSAADVQIVAWTSGDETLKSLLRRRLDIYTETETGLWNDPRLPRDRGLRKNCVHSADYGAWAKTIADKYIGNLQAAEYFLKRWFEQHPNIRAWQRHVEFDLLSRAEIRNAWGSRRVYTDRVSLRGGRINPKILHQALAWIGQSTVAITINKILLRIDHEEQRHGFPCFILLQDHDNLVMQCPTSQLDEVATELFRLAAVEIPFSDPLVIPASLKVSERSWADVKEWAPVPAISLTG